MFKPLPPDLVGYITESASRIATTLRVDPVLYSWLVPILDGTGWTYLHIKSAGKVEVVKVTKNLGLSRICVERGLEGTKREAILANTQVYYARTLSSIYDEVRTQVSPITLTATGVNPVFAPVVQVESNTSLEVTTNGTLHDGNYDPCKPYVCPGYTFGPFYFTSKLYPIELIEGMRGSVATVIGWDFSPYDIESMVGGVARAASGELREILNNYTGWVGGGTSETDPDGDSSGRGEWIEGGVAAAVAGTLRQILKAYTYWPAEGLTGGVARPGNGTIRQILIQYDNWQTTTNGINGERLIGGVAKAVSGTLT
jgi:hypothetical protein